jgi:uncharacterized repeat protein (TIGR03803 family)
MQFQSTLIRVVLLSACLGSFCWAATSEHVIHSFSGPDGSNAATDLVFDAHGNLYGTTVTGGVSGCGTVFQLTPAGGGQWNESVLFSFDCLDTGKNPHGGVTLDSQGNIYGTTVAGGTGGFCAGDGCGVVFKLSQSGGSWVETVIYNFQDSPDGWGAGGAVVFDALGNLYGTTPDGGANDEGTVYQLSPSNGQWTETILHNFTGGDDGAVGGLGRLLVDRGGNLYGVTEIGGHYQAGTVFRMGRVSVSSWHFATLYAFRGGLDASSPYGGLISDAHGNLYGTTYYGGKYAAGTVYQLSPGVSATGEWRESLLNSFGDLAEDGLLPLGTLVLDAAGNLLGTTSEGGDVGCNCGVVFELTPDGHGNWGESVPHKFGLQQDAATPLYGLTADGAGNYYGATAYGGTSNLGAVYELTP